MRNRALRVTLTLLAVGALGAAAWLAWSIERGEIARRAAAATFGDALVRAQRDVFELRAAQQAYVAAGQSETYWFDKVTTLSESVRKLLGELDTSAPSIAVKEALAGTTAALRAFEGADRRARSYAATGQKLLASDIIFGDGLAATGSLAASLDAAGQQAAAAGRAAAAAAQRQQLSYVAGGVGAMLLALILLTPGPKPASLGAREGTGSPAPVRATLDLQLRQDPEPVAAERPAPPPLVEKPAVPPPAAPERAPAVELQALASVCTDLAKLADTDTLPGILERAARSLDASGLVLWVADYEGAELVPVATHGYPASVLSRLGTIRRDAANATGAAFRTGLVQTVPASGAANGAIAAPLVTPSGCRGVMSAEIRSGGEKQVVKLAAAAIIAAQLSSLVGPPPAPASQEREAAI